MAAMFENGGHCDSAWFGAVSLFKTLLIACSSGENRAKLQKLIFPLNGEGCGGRHVGLRDVGVKVVVHFESTHI